MKSWYAVRDFWIFLNQMLVKLKWSISLSNLIFVQVFGELIENCQSDAQQNSVQRGSSDLKEHMVGILFSRRKLNNLQKQVEPRSLYVKIMLLYFFTQVLYNGFYILYTVMLVGILDVYVPDFFYGRVLINIVAMNFC